MYQDLRASIKHINTQQGFEELKSQLDGSEWILQTYHEPQHETVNFHAGPTYSNSHPSL